METCNQVYKLGQNIFLNYILRQLSIKTEEIQLKLKQK